MHQFKEIIAIYEDTSIHLVQNYKDRSVEELELIILDFQALYQYGDPEIDYGNPEIDRDDLISLEDWLIFGNWQPSTQTDFLAYLAIKIAVARS